MIAGDPETDEEVVAARWGLAEPAHDIDAVIAALRANDVAEAREAFRLYDSLSGNYCFSDQEGDIAYQYVGRIPKRPAYPLPVPGWSGEYEWDGDVPKDQLPVDENPDTGFIITANNRTTDESYPHYLSMTSTRFRADRLRELLDETEVFSLDDMPALQADVVSVLARELAEHLTAFEASDARARERRVGGPDRGRHGGRGVRAGADGRAGGDFRGDCGTIRWLGPARRSARHRHLRPDP